MPRPRETADLDRRDVLQLGLAGASALVLGSSPRTRAGETPGIERKGLMEVDSTTPQQVDLWADEVEPRVIAWRRYIHQRPELSYEEVQTAAYVADVLRAMPGIEVHTGIAKTGIKAVLKGGKPGPVIALRADMDALPVEEKTDLPFRSHAKAMWQGQETFVAHVCGHDTHVAMLLGAAEILSTMRADLPGTVVFLFQPAEEWSGQGSPSGAFEMVKAGVLDNPRVEAVFGQHIDSSRPGGLLTYRRGVTAASSDGFEVKIKGVGTHAARPWAGKDPIVVASQLVTLMQSIVSRQTDLSTGAAVVTVGQMYGGNRYNVIPEEATLVGTIRTLNDATRTHIHESVGRMAEKVAEASGLTADVKITPGYPVLSNDPALTGRMLEALERAAGPGKVREVPPTMTSEDFGAFSSVVPGFFWRLRASPFADRPGASNHSPFFAIDEQYLTTGVKALLHVSLAYMQGQAAQ
jgi:amidohydrolase